MIGKFAQCLRALIAAPALLCIEAPAQQPFRAADYLPNDYRNVAFIDFAQARSTGVWKQLRAGGLDAALGWASLGLGVGFDDLDSLKFVAQRVASRGIASHYVDTWILRGNKPFGSPGSSSPDQWVSERVGGLLLRYRHGATDGRLAAADDALVLGGVERLRALAKEPQRRGYPCPDILSLMSARKQGLLANLVYAFEVDDGDMIPGLLPDQAWEDGARPQFALLRLSATSTPEGPLLSLELVLRHPKAGDGVALTKHALEAGLREVLADPRYSAYRKALSKHRSEIDGSDFSITFDLGQARAVAGLVSKVVTQIWGGPFSNSKGQEKPKSPVEEGESGKAKK